MTKLFLTTLSLKPPLSQGKRRQKCSLATLTTAHSHHNSYNCRNKFYSIYNGLSDRLTCRASRFTRSLIATTNENQLVHAQCAHSYFLISINRLSHCLYCTRHESRDKSPNIISGIRDGCGDSIRSTCETIYKIDG